ncbi:amino acid ABC transporter substrate-binding protein [Thalassospira alkalitolerans]|uniref:amino acid ABC transporter substrate-binding protein n=1 Tax=Thalassospira alkalitolerans TaxID=1293890 RepID=UPI003AA9A655
MQISSRLRIATLAAATTALIGTALLGAQAQAQDTYRIGYAISKTGPGAPGANTSTIPNYEMWVKEVNDAGGLKVGDKMIPIEVVEYDDRSSSEEAVRAIERLINQDKVDFILSPWGTGLNLAVAPILDRAGYAHLAGTAVSDKAPQLSKRWKNSYWLLGTGSQYANELATFLDQLKSDGKINNKVAMIAVADGFGIELSNAGRKALEKHDFELVYDKTYPLGSQDLATIVNEIKSLDADTFVAFSYPPGTLGLTEQARVLNFNPKIFYAGVGTAFPLYKDRFGADAQGVVSLGGASETDPKIADYIKRHIAFAGREPDRWASIVNWASLQSLQQAIERAGSTDRDAINAELAKGGFDTILGSYKPGDQNFWQVGQWQDGKFVGIAPTSMDGAQSLIFPKPDWKGAQ